jgi:hypothetical protein
MAGPLRRLIHWKHFRWLFPLVLAMAIYAGYRVLRRDGGLPPLPVPNGYDDLVEAGREISGEPPSVSPSESADVPTLKTLVETNQEPLRLARLGLSRECGVTLGDTRQQLETHLHETGIVRKVSRLLVAEAKVAESEGRDADAADSYLDLYRLGRKSSAGGLMIDGNLGYAFESLGSIGLSGIRARLAPAEQKRVMLALVAIDRNRESPVRAVGRDRIWFRRTAGSWERFMLDITGAGKQLLKPAIAQFELSDRRSQTYLRLLIADLAVHARHADTGKYPDKLDELVPRELDAVPVDPFSGHPLGYTVKGEAYVLYSIGPDGRDDHGTPIPEKARWDQAKGDVVLSPPRP